jgi:hypothetical protein
VILISRPGSTEDFLGCRSWRTERRKPPGPRSKPKNSKLPDAAVSRAVKLPTK